MNENTEKTDCSDRCDTNLKREVNSAENQDDEPRLKLLKQEEDHEQASSSEVFFIDNKCDKDAYTRFMSMDGSENTDEQPSYRTDDFIQLDDSEPDEPAAGDAPPQPSVVCFNCGGNHFLNECTKEIDMARVSQKRREMARERDVAPKKLRYFEHEMLSQRFQPGKYSKELREALDLHPEDLPLFIYRMRVLGYPPGWLTYAEVENSGLKIYGLDDPGTPDENVEDGEVDCGNKQVQYDPARLFDFPGFNVPVPLGVRDLCEEYGMPPMLQHQQRSEAEKYLKAPVAKSFNQRQKLPPPAIQPSTDIGQVVDMHIDDGVDDEEVCFEAENISAVVTADSPTDSKCASTNICQECLVPELPSVASDCNNAASSSSTESTEREQPSPVTIQNGSTSNSDDSPSGTPKGKTHKVTLGTPMLIGFSKYTSLPPRENFAKDMTDYIPFENLPGTTGRYDKLRTVIEKVRALHEENEKNEDS